MVNFEIPSQYTFSPSEGTPHLTINREATIDLDSSNAFEGKCEDMPKITRANISRPRKVARGLVRPSSGCSPSWNEEGRLEGRERRKMDIYA